MAKGTILIDQEHCKGCRLCISACPQGLIVIDELLINRKGYHPAVLKDEQGKCTGCSICALMCPDVCISVYREPNRRSAAAKASVQS